MRPRTLTCLAFIAVAACTSPQVANGPASSSKLATASGRPPTPPVATSLWPASTTGPCAPALPAGSPPLVAIAGPGVGGVDGPAQTFDSHGTVAITGSAATGPAPVSAQFQPRSTYADAYTDASGQLVWAEPYLYVGPGEQVVLSPHEAYVVRGSVYFIDGYGTVFRMGVDGIQTVVTKFPIQLDQQEVSFAVSPDGCQLVATILKLPPIPRPGPPGQPPPPLAGTWTLQTMSAIAGGDARVLRTWTSTVDPDSQTTGTFQNIVLVGWDSVGPIAVVHSNLGIGFDAYQNAYRRPIQNPDFFGGSLAHVAPDGMPGQDIALGGASGCKPIQVTPGGDVTCFDAVGTAIRLSVVSTTGSTELDPTDFVPQPEGTFDVTSARALRLVAAA